MKGMLKCFHSPKFNQMSELFLFFSRSAFQYLFVEFENYYLFYLSLEIPSFWVNLFLLKIIMKITNAVLT